MIIGDSLLVPINNNHSILSTSSFCNSSSTATTNTISNNSINTTTTTSSPTLPPAAMLQQQALKCPRCDSSHTKFCYYNNYSLSQPRHFCKACKRYWTRGGTLRSVPVGGGCRKNKRAKKATPTSSTTAAASSTSNIPHNSSLVASTPLPATTTTHDHLNSLFHGLLPSAAVASGLPTLLPQMYDQLQPQMSALGIGFSSGRRHHEEGSQLGFGACSLADLQQTGSSFLNNYQPSLNVLEAGGSLELLPKQVKVEGENNVVRSSSNNSDGIEWQDQAAPDMNSGDSSSYLYWSSAIFGGAGWPDIANSSIAPII